MTSAIKIILTLPMADFMGMGSEYIRGYVDATLAPIHQDIEAGMLDVGAMLDAGWELDIPAVDTPEVRVKYPGTLAVG